MSQNKTTNQNWYIEHELKPALAWADSKDGKEWISMHYPSFVFSLYNQRNVAMGYEYAFYYKSTPIYHGECLKISRLFVHFWHQSTEPELYFGVTREEIDEGLITLRILETGIKDKKERERRELELRKINRPVLNPAKLGNRCIPKNERYAAVHQW